MRLQIKRRVAVISCEPDSQEPLSFRGKSKTIREITAIRLRELGLEPIIHRPLNDISDFPAIGKIGGIVIGGSKLSLHDLEKNDWMKKLLDFIQRAHEKVPILGLCFGHQAVGISFGSKLEKFNSTIGCEVGFSEVMRTSESSNDPLLGESPAMFDALFSHFDYLATESPHFTVLLRSTNLENHSIQAFRAGDSTWGLQFHPEYTTGVVRDLVHARQKILEPIIDVDSVLFGLCRIHRADTAPLRNFVNFMARD